MQEDEIETRYANEECKQTKLEEVNRETGTEGRQIE